MYKKSISYIFFSLFFAVSLTAQTAIDAEKLFNNQNYASAAEAYKNLLAKQPKDLLFNYRYARSCFECKEYQKAVSHFEFSKDKYPLSNYYLGEIYQFLYRFDESVVAYGRYISGLNESDARLPKLQERLDKAKKADEMLKRVEDIAIIDSVIVDKSKFLQAYNFAPDLGKISSNRLMVDSVIVEQVRYTTQRNDRTIFSKAINNNLDIVTSYKLLNSWSDETSISAEINTDANENYPFLMSDGVTFYFASDGENSIGGYDIFVTRFNPSKNDYYSPENIGMPFNSPFNDYMMVVDDIRRIGWFASDRYQPEGKIVVYTFVPNEEKRILRIENEDSVRRYAQLNLFRESERDAKNNYSNTIKQNVEDAPLYTFIVNDDIVYHSISEFKNAEAADSALLLKMQQENLIQMKSSLDNLRAEYGKADDEERSLIAPKILEIEKLIVDTEKRISELTIIIRNLEIFSLKNAE